MDFNLYIFLQKYPKYTLEVEAADMRGEGLTVNGHVHLTVTDSNDNAPAFEMAQASKRVKTFPSLWNQTHFFSIFGLWRVNIKPLGDSDLTSTRLLWDLLNCFEAEVLLEKTICSDSKGYGKLSLPSALQDKTHG